MIFHRVSLFLVVCATFAFSQDKHVYVIRGQLGSMVNAYRTWNFLPHSSTRPLELLTPVRAKFRPGVGGEFSFGYMLRPHLLVSYQYGGYTSEDREAGGNLSQSVSLAVGQIYFSQSNLRPYGHAGVGMTHMEMTYLAPLSVRRSSIDRWYPVLAVGGGAEYSISEEAVVNLQVTAHILFGDKTFRMNDASFRSAWTGASSFSHYRLSESLNFLAISGGLVFKIGF